VLSFMNRQRSAAGLAALSRNGCLDSKARAWSQQMAASGSLGHNPNTASDTDACLSWTSRAENVAYSSSAAAVNDLFWGSSSHRDNILRASVTMAGVGAVRASDGTLWVTVMFAG
jgi:uncharacterized protein YkwD